MRKFTFTLLSVLMIFPATAYAYTPLEPDDFFAPTHIYFPDRSFTQEFSPVVTGLNIAGTGTGNSLLQTQEFDGVLKQDNEKCNFFRTPYARFIIPAGLITYGVVAQCNPLLQNVNKDVEAYALKIFPGRTHVDDWLQYVPLVPYFGLDFIGVKSRHDILDRTILAATSYLIMAAAVNTMKLTIKVQRPDHSAWNSFPSGHTATVFTGAHLLFKEYKDTSPWIGVAGYAVATATGVMRMLNRRHWLSDVVTGAGIGIASVEIAYLLLPLFDKLTKRDKLKGERETCMVISPIVGSNYLGAGLSYTF